MRVGVLSLVKVFEATQDLYSGIWIPALLLPCRAYGTPRLLIAGMTLEMRRHDTITLTVIPAKAGIQ